MLIGGIDFGEGPRWHDGRLWYSDFYRHGVFAVTTGGEREQVVALDDHPSGLGWLPDGRLLLVSMKARRVLRREPDGSIVLHADLSRARDRALQRHGRRRRRHRLRRQLRLRPLVGRARAGTPTSRLVRPDGTVEVAAEDLAFPNGIGHHARRRHADRRRVDGPSIHRVRRRRPTGALSGRRVWAELGDIGPDGCTLDAEGAIWCADALHGVLVRVREGGEITHRADLGQKAYACALGGDDGRTLFAMCAESPREEDAAGTGTGTIRTCASTCRTPGCPERDPVGSPPTWAVEEAEMTVMARDPVDDRERRVPGGARDRRRPRPRAGRGVRAQRRQGRTGRGRPLPAARADRGASPRRRRRVARARGPTRASTRPCSRTSTTCAGCWRRA